MASFYDDKYNYLRKIILSRIESKQNMPTNSQLGILGLTTYFSKESLSDSLLDKIFFEDNSERKIGHIFNDEKYFMPLQFEALKFLEKNRRAILLAPTSFGKTLIVKEYIFKHQPRSIVYIVPTNALAYELEKNFKENNETFGEYQIFDKSLSLDISPDQKRFFIGTQEKYLEVANTFSDIDLFVIDEAYKLEDDPNRQRGYKLSKTFLDSVERSSNKIFLLCPVANLVGFEGYGFEVFKTKFNAVDKKYTALSSEEDFFAKLNELSNNEKTILFCSAPDDISECYKYIKGLKGINSKFVQSLKEDFHQEWSVAKFAEKGVCVHHGQMPKYIQNKMINEFLGNENATLLIGTNSISEGINTPTKNLFIHPKAKINEDLMLIKNTIGRAGRLGIIPIGHIYSLTDLSFIDDNDPDITLSISSEEKIEILKEPQNQDKINDFSMANSITSEFLVQLVEDTKMSLRTLSNVFAALRKNRDFKSYNTIVNIAQESFPDDYHSYGFADSILLNGLFNNYYVIDNERKPLKTYDDKIKYFRLKYDNAKKMSDSVIVDKYMKLLYSSLDNYLLVVANIGKRIMESFPNWPFGDNVENIINTFLSKYYLKIYHVTNMEDYNESEQKILLSLREYGFDLGDGLISGALIKEIEAELNVRYSTYDILNAVKSISNSDGPFSHICKRLVEKYL